MNPVTTSVTIDRPQDQVYAYLDVLANHEGFTDHCMRGWQTGGPRTHRQVPNAGHNLPQETADAFARAVLALTRAPTYDIDGSNQLVG